jgi:hypothetical protein
MYHTGWHTCAYGSWDWVLLNCISLLRMNCHPSEQLRLPLSTSSDTSRRSRLVSHPRANRPIPPSCGLACHPHVVLNATSSCGLECHVILWACGLGVHTRHGSAMALSVPPGVGYRCIGSCATPLKLSMASHVVVKIPVGMRLPYLRMCVDWFSVVGGCSISYRPAINIFINLVFIIVDVHWHHHNMHMFSVWTSIQRQ